MRFSKSFGFTLAETLITLTIIGIVAALTLPSLIQNHKKQEASARLKKFYSSMEQAIRLSEIDNGDAREWARAGNNIKNDEGKIDYEANGKVTKEFFLKYLAPYIKYTKIVEAKNIIDDDGELIPANNKVYMPDGSYFYLWNGGCIDVTYDVNGERKPNVTGRDKFTMLLCINQPVTNERINRFGNDQTVFGVYSEPQLLINKSREKSLESCKTIPSTCSNLLQMDGWEFKDDYPHRL